MTGCPDPAGADRGIASGGLASAAMLVRVVEAMGGLLDGWLLGWKTTAVMCLAVRAAVVG